MIQRTFLSLILLVALVPRATGQQPQQRPTTEPPKPATAQPEAESQDVVKITTNLVQVDAVVTKDGKQVTDLKPEDFQVFEDGKPQTITDFSYVSNVPTIPSNVTATPAAKDKNAAPVVPSAVRPHDVRRTIALVIDDLGMSFQSVSFARSQARKFVNEQLQPNDLVAIIHTSGEVGALQQFTTDPRMIYNAIDRLRWYPCSRAGINVFGPIGSPTTPPELPCGSSRNINGTLQVLRFIVEGMRDLPGRKSLVLMSDQLPVETQDPATTTLTPGDGDLADDRRNYRGQLKKVAELAIRASVVIYAVDTRGLAYTGITVADDFRGTSPRVTARDITNTINSTLSARSMAMIAGREGSDLIARQTGGFMIRNSNDFGLKKIAEDQNGYYLIGYRPPDETFNRKFHHLKVTVKRRGLVVRTREGFFGVGEESEKPVELTAGDQLKKALLSPFGANDITVRLTTMFTNFDNGSLLRSLLFIKAQDLVFVDEPDGGHKATFDLGIILFGENGRVADQQSRLITLRLHNDTYQSALHSGIVYSLDTPLKQAGAFQFRIALRDQGSSRIGSAGQFIQIPNVADGRLALSGLVVLKDIPDKPESASPNQQDAQDAISSGPAVRQFRQSDKLIFAYSIYNAQPDAATHLPQLTAQTRIFRDGKPVFTGTPAAIEVAPQSDLKRVPSVGRLQLGTEFPPGEYVLQIMVTDKLAKEKQQIASQWIDFEVVK
ncbi:MAG TPA: VWA domain-containing protein [Pyrinomonadaceae bacterium]